MKKDFEKDESQILEKTDRLVSSIEDFSNTLSIGEKYDLKLRIQHCAGSVAPNVEAGYKNNKKLEKMRSWIRANSFLEECKDYLAMIERMKYANTQGLIKEIDEVSELLRNQCFVR